MANLGTAGLTMTRGTATNDAGASMTQHVAGQSGQGSGLVVILTNIT